MKISNRQATEAQHIVNNLLNMNLPVKTRFEIAQLSVALDEQVYVFAKVRDVLIRKYHVKTKPGATEGSVDMSTEQGDEALFEFIRQVDELLVTEGKDINITIHLPSNTLEGLDPIAMKPILNFVEIV